jgi:hypothetical protein
VTAISTYSEERRFGFLFSVLFIFAAGYFGFGSMNFYPAVSLIGIGSAFFVCALCRPQLLSQLNRRWHQIGRFLGQIMRPMILGFVFFGVITPVALLMRAIGRDELKVRERSCVASYWVARHAVDGESDSLKNQF